jgi:hypothetical protein
MSFSKRRILWLSAALVAPFVVGMYLLAPPSRINKANCGRIHDGMSEDEVLAILGLDDSGPVEFPHTGPHDVVYFRTWSDGPTRIIVTFYDGEVVSLENGKNHWLDGARIYGTTPWEIITWYVEKAAGKIGLKRG